MPVDDFDAARAGVRFARTLRDAGVAADATRLDTFLHGIDSVGVDDVSRAYWVGRASFCSDPADFAAYDAAFRACFGYGATGAGDTADAGPAPAPMRLEALAPTMRNMQAESELSDRSVEVSYSATEVLRTKDFAELSDEEFEGLARLMARIRFGPQRSSRRLGPSRRGRPDLRATLRASLRSGGEIDRWRHRNRTTRPRRVLLVCDISGSMEPYARAFLRFMHAAVCGTSTTEAFCVGTRLTRVTDELGSRDPDAALRAASASVQDWSGGTRLGESMLGLLDTWGQRGAARGAIAVVLSDGWDRGDPAVLGEQMARLHRLAHKVVWVNPLKARPGYAPLAGGMAAALPHVDALVEGHNWLSLERLADEVLSA